MTLWDDPVKGDLQEEYHYLARHESKGYAIRWLVKQWVRLSGRTLGCIIYRSWDMLNSYVKTAVRNFCRHRSYTLINIIGLTIGLVACFLIASFVQDDLSFDQFNQDKDRVYRIYCETTHSGQPFVMALTMLPLAPAITEELPEVEACARISIASNVPFAINHKIFRERIYFVDQPIMDILTFSLKFGDAETALSQPNGLILTAAQSLRFFGDENPLGKSIELDRGKHYVVTGVFEPWPGNSHLPPAAMASLNSLLDNPHQRWNDWTSFGNDYTYVKLTAGTQLSSMEDKLALLHTRHVKSDEIGDDRLRLQALTDIHFSNFNYDMVRTSGRQRLLIFSMIGFFILLIAVFNFINLTTARIALRSKEVGIRKVSGAQRMQLLRQFLVESLSLSAMAGGLALLISIVLLPPFGSLLRRALSSTAILNPALMGLAVALILVVGLLAGLYPALKLSGIKPITSLKKLETGRHRFVSMKTVLVILQFVISITLIVATFTIQRQRNYMMDRPLGFNPHQTISIILNSTPFHGRTEALKAAALALPGVESVAFSHSVPGSGISTASTYTKEGSDEEYYLFGVLSDGNMVETMGFTLLQGRTLREHSQSDAEDAILINESAAKLLGWTDPINRIVVAEEKCYRVVGLVKDAHFESMRYSIEPMLFRISTRVNFMMLRIDPAQVQAISKEMESAWKAIIPGDYPLRLFFFDQAFERYYRSEKRMAEVFTVCAALAVLLSCLGMVALAAFVVNQRLKEMGIRKVLGASTGGLLLNLCVQFIKWVMAASVLAVPLSYWGMERFLQQYPYRTSVPWWLLAMAVGLAICACMVSVLGQTWRAARIQPAQILKSE
ncbi:ABC transporter permease [bacterium]|nr:ABC transporter permease [bacterium]